jgi:hypothetical protein
LLDSRFPYIFQFPTTSLRRIRVLPQKNGAIIPAKASVVKNTPSNPALFILFRDKHINTNYF